MDVAQHGMTGVCLRELCEPFPLSPRDNLRVILELRLIQMKRCNGKGYEDGEWEELYSDLADADEG